MISGELSDDGDFAALAPRSDEQSADQGAAGAGSKGSAGKKRGRPASSETKPASKAAAKPTAKSSKTRAEKPERTCDLCQKKAAEGASFYAGQSKCKDCANALRGLFRAAESQGCKQSLQDRTRDERFMRNLVKAYDKARKGQKKTGQRIKFSVAEFYENYTATDGSRRQVQSDYMTQKVWMKHAQSIEGGEYTESEAADLWQKWLADPKVCRDYDGPRGQVQLEIRLKTSSIKFEEVARERGLRRTEKLGRNASDKALAEKYQCVVGESGQQDHDFLNWQEAREQMARGMNNSIAGSAFNDEGLMAPLVLELADAVENRTKKPRALQEPGDNDHSGSTSEEGADDEGDSTGAGGVPRDSPLGKKWVDMERTWNKAERTFDQQCRTIQGSLEKIQKEVQTIILEVQRIPSEARQLSTELALVVRRQKWLEAIYVSPSLSYGASTHETATHPKRFDCRHRNAEVSNSVMLCWL